MFRLRHLNDTRPLFCPLLLKRKFASDYSGQPPIQFARHPRPRRAILCSTASSSFRHRWTCTARFPQSRLTLRFALPTVRRVPPTERRKALADSPDPSLILPLQYSRLCRELSPNSARRWSSEKLHAPHSARRDGPAPQRTPCSHLSDPRRLLRFAAR